MVTHAPFLWDFGDGTTLSGDLATEPTLGEANGDAVFTVPHTYSTGGALLATLRVVDGEGAIGFDTTNVYVCADPDDDVILSGSATIDQGHANIIGCGAIIEGEWMTITLVMEDSLVDGDGDPENGDIQYRLRLGLSGQSNEKLIKYRDGDTTGMKRLTFAIKDNTISFRFSLRELGWKSTTGEPTVRFSAETRGGAEGTGAAGLLDRMPDDGSVVEFHE